MKRRKPRKQFIKAGEAFSLIFSREKPVYLDLRFYGKKNVLVLGVSSKPGFTRLSRLKVLREETLNAVHGIKKQLLERKGTRFLRFFKVNPKSKKLEAEILALKKKKAFDLSVLRIASFNPWKSWVNLRRLFREVEETAKKEGYDFISANVDVKLVKAVERYGFKKTLKKKVKIKGVECMPMFKKLKGASVSEKLFRYFKRTEFEVRRKTAKE